jgi:hypothetical protein
MPAFKRLGLRPQTPAFASLTQHLWNPAVLSGFIEERVNCIIQLQEIVLLTIKSNGHEVRVLMLQGRPSYLPFYCSRSPSPLQQPTPAALAVEARADLECCAFAVDLKSAVINCYIVHCIETGVHQCCDALH